MILYDGKNLALKRLSATNISTESFRLVEKVGVVYFAEMARKNILFSEYEKECHEWLKQETNLFDKLFIAVNGRAKPTDYIDNDIDEVLYRVNIADLIKSLSPKQFNDAPALVKAVIEIAENDASAQRMDNPTLLIVGLDYLKEGNEFIRYCSIA